MARGAKLGRRVGQKAATFVRCADHQLHLPSCCCSASPYSSLRSSSPRSRAAPSSFSPFRVGSSSPGKTLLTELYRRLPASGVLSSPLRLKDVKTGCRLCSVLFSSAVTADCLHMPRDEQKTLRRCLDPCLTPPGTSGKGSSFGLSSRSARTFRGTRETLGGGMKPRMLSCSSPCFSWTGAANPQPGGTSSPTVSLFPFLSSAPGSGQIEMPEGGAWAAQIRCFATTSSSGSAQVILSKERHGKAHDSSWVNRAGGHRILCSVSSLACSRVPGTNCGVLLLPLPQVGCGSRCEAAVGRGGLSREVISG